MSKKSRLKTWIIVIVIWMIWFFDFSFADNVAQNDNFNVLSFSLNYLGSALAWLWIFFANLAWTFLTNKWIYWEVLWWDALLWKLWNVMKNIANFWLWFYFVYTVFKWLIQQGKEDITKKLKDIILWLLIAWVWIQASWFFTAAVIDVSSVTLAAAGSFPSQMIDSTTYENIEKSVKSSLSQFGWKEYVLFPKDSKAAGLLAVYNIEVVEQSDEKWMDEIMPNDRNVAWPLYFIWFSILQSYKVPSINTSSIKWAKATILNTIIESWTTVVYAIEMLMLCVIALIRIIYLWMFIVLSPIAILLRCIEKSWEKKLFESWLIKWLRKHIKLKTFFINVFKPTIIVLCFWVALIFTSLMNQIVIDYTWRTLNVGGAELSSTKEGSSNINGNVWDQKYTTVIDDNWLHFIVTNVWKTALELVLAIITVIMVYLIVNIGIKMWKWEDFMSKHVSWISESFGKMMSSMPVIPFVWYDKNWVAKESTISFDALKWIPSAFWTKLNTSIREINADQEDNVRELWWLKKDGELSSRQQSDIISAWNTARGLDILTAKKEAIGKIKDEKWKWLTLNPQTSAGNWFWIQEFTKWLNTVDKSTLSWEPAWENMVSDRRALAPDEKKDQRTLENLFKGTRGSTHVQTYAKFFGLDKSIDTWSELKEADISKGKAAETK